jgi:uroporphyrinogen-III synthase
VLLTGPVQSIESWADAAREAGWDPIVRPLVRTLSIEVDLAPLLAEPLAWLALTSSAALRALEADGRALEHARSLRTAVVGAATAERARSLGLALALEPAPRASELAREMLARAERGALVLWPRGSLSDELARLLREGGLRVLDPIVYRTEECASTKPLPEADAVLLASPSGVRAYAASPRAGALPKTALALGPTTRAALEAARLGFGTTHVLDEPDASAFTRLLARLGS